MQRVARHLTTARRNVTVKGASVCSPTSIRMSVWRHVRKASKWDITHLCNPSTAVGKPAWALAKQIGAYLACAGALKFS
jgi:hypothetical protein